MITFKLKPTGVEQPVTAIQTLQKLGLSLKTAHTFFDAIATGKTLCDCPCKLKWDEAVAKELDELGILMEDYQKVDVFVTQGQGTCFAGAFDTLQEAVDYVREHEGSGSFGIRLPDGTYI